MKNFNSIIALVLSTVSLAACGNGMNSGELAPESAYSPRSSSYDPVTDVDPGYACPDSANILPDYDWNLNGSGYYSACPSRTEYYKVKIHGRTAQSSEICVFPAEYINQNTVYTKPEYVGGPPQVRCYPAQQGGVVADFPKTLYNSFFIVEGHDKDRMLACLPGGNYYNCPRYSFGRFR